MVASCTKRRFQCRRFGHGSGWIRSIRASECCRRPGQQFGGVAGEQPDIADVMGLDLRQDLRHAVDIGFAADEAGVGKGARFRDQMLAAAESDFEPDRVDRRVEQPGEIRRCGAAISSDKPRQQMLDQVGLMRPQSCDPCGGQRTSHAGARASPGDASRFVALAGWRAHRSVWYSRYSSRVRGSIDEIYICSSMGMRALAIDAEAVEGCGIEAR